MLVLEFDSAWPFNVNILSPAPQGWAVIKNFLETSPPLPFPFSLSSSFALSSTSTTWTDKDSFSCLPSTSFHTDNGNNNKVDTTTTTPTRNIPPPSPDVAWFPPVMPLDSAVEGVYVRASEPRARVGLEGNLSDHLLTYSFFGLAGEYTRNRYGATGGCMLIS